MFRVPEGGPSPLALLYRVTYDSSPLALKSAQGKRMLQQLERPARLCLQRRQRVPEAQVLHGI